MLSYKNKHNKYPTIAPLLSIGLVFSGAFLLMGCQNSFNFNPWLVSEEDIASSNANIVGVVYVDLTLPTLYETQEWICKECRSRNPNRLKACPLCNTINIDESKEWQCEECTFLNHLLLKTCEECDAERPSYIDEDLYTSSSESEEEEEDVEEEVEDCPICFEDSLKTQETYDCKQCKKSICKPCYQGLLKSNNTCCPLCRYEEYLSQEEPISTL